MGAVLAVALMLAIFAVVGFGKTAKDLKKIEKAVNEKQKLLEEDSKEKPQLPVYNS